MMKAMTHIRVGLGMVFLALFSCSNTDEDRESSAEDTLSSIKGRAIVVILDARNQKPIDLYEFDPRADPSVVQIRFHLDETYKELEFLLVGDAIDANLKWVSLIKSGYQKGGAFNVAVFHVNGGKLSRFVGNGYGSGNLGKSQVDFLNQYREKPPRIIKMEIGYLLGNEADGGDVIALVNPKTRSYSLRKRTVKRTLGTESEAEIETGELSPSMAAKLKEKIGSPKRK